MEFDSLETRTAFILRDKRLTDQPRCAGSVCSRASLLGCCRGAKAQELHQGATAFVLHGLLLGVPLQRAEQQVKCTSLTGGRTACIRCLDAVLIDAACAEEHQFMQACAARLRTVVRDGCKRADQKIGRSRGSRRSSRAHLRSSRSALRTARGPPDRAGSGVAREPLIWLVTVMRLTDTHPSRSSEALKRGNVVTSLANGARASPGREAHRRR
eukprot:scaffold96607_cov66-Phaeocystis_antarctica.AAC.2